MDGEWFKLWFDDKMDIMVTMRRNIVADLEAGRDPEGASIMKQTLELTEYEHGFNVQIDLFKNMDDKQVERWCYYDLKKRGAIL